MKQQKSYFLVSFLCCGLLLSSCVHEPLFSDDPDNPGNPNPPADTTGQGGPDDPVGTPCDPATIYFENDILPILASNCALSGCHNAASAEDGVILDSYQNVMNTTDVEPFQPSESEIIEVLFETDPDKRMPPPGQTPLLPAQISLIQEWILQGAENLTCSDSTSVCQTDQISFSGFVFPLIQNKCLGCHSGSTPGGGYDFSTHSGVALVANNGALLGAISHSPGFSPMPQSGNQLSACEISKIESWINAGSPNN